MLSTRFHWLTIALMKRHPWCPWGDHPITVEFFPRGFGFGGPLLLDFSYIRPLRHDFFWDDAHGEYKRNSKWGEASRKNCKSLNEIPHNL